MGIDTEKIQKIRDEIAQTPSNKATQGHLGLLKAKLANLEDSIEQKKKGTGSSWGGYAVKKNGDGTAVLVGYPSVGKSTLLNMITSAESEVGSYDFTTLDVIPGMLQYRLINLQILDVPGLVSGAASGKGRGKEVLAVVRIADLVMILIDAAKGLGQLKNIETELYMSGIRLNRKKPRVYIRKKDRGGIIIDSAVQLTHINEETIRSILEGYRISNAHILFNDNITDDELIDVIRDNRIYVSSFVVVNKIDILHPKKKEMLLRSLKNHDYITISAKDGTNVDVLKDKIMDTIGFIHVFTKPIGKQADFEDPLIMKKGATISDLCDKLHRSFKEDFNFAKVWGKSAKFPGQQKNLTHRLMDDDIVELHLS